MFRSLIAACMASALTFASPASALWMPEDDSVFDDFLLEVLTLPQACDAGTADRELVLRLVTGRFAEAYGVDDRLHHEGIRDRFRPALDRQIEEGQVIADRSSIRLRECPDLTADVEGFVRADVTYHFTRFSQNCRVEEGELNSVIQRVGSVLRLQDPDITQDRLAALQTQVDEVLAAMWTDGTILQDGDGAFLANCDETSPYQRRFKADQVDFEVGQLDDEEIVPLVEGIMAEVGCVVALDAEESFAEFAIKKMTDEFGLDVPEDLSTPVWGETKEALSEMEGALDRGFTLLRRADRFTVDGTTARLSDCTPVGEVMFTSPTSSAAPEVEGIVSKAFAAVGCRVPRDDNFVFREFFLHQTALSAGIEWTVEDLLAAIGAFGIEYPDGPAGEALSELYRAALDHEMELFDAGVIQWDGDALVHSDCVATGGLETLDPYR